MLRRIVFVFIAFMLTGLVFAQMAPRESVTATIGGGKVTIEYGRPSLKGRSFDELASKLPADRMWRAGSEQITTLTASLPVTIGGKMIPAGKYSLYVHCPQSGSYSLVVNRVLGQPLKNLWSEAPANLANEPWPHMDYREIQDSEVARVPLTRVKSSDSGDLFTITISKVSGGASLNLEWGDQHWSAPLFPARSDGSHREGS